MANRSTLFRLATSLPAAALGLCCAIAPARAEIPGSEQTRLPYQILVPGVFSSDELPPDVDGPWYAMTIRSGKASLKRVRVRLIPTKNPRATGDLSVPGAIVRSTASDSVLFFVRRGAFKESSVTTWYLGEGRITAGTELPIRYPQNRRWTIAASKKSYDSGYLGYLYRITARDKTLGRFQRFGTYPEGCPCFQWVGDLDGDGKMDVFVLDTSHESGAMFWTLYLSRNAQGKALFQKVGEFYTPGC